MSLLQRHQIHGEDAKGAKDSRGLLRILRAFAVRFWLRLEAALWLPLKNE